MITADPALPATKQVSSLARWLAVLFVYKCETQKIYFFSPTHFRDMMADQLPAELTPARRRKVRALVRVLVRGVYTHFYDLIRRIDEESENWSIARLHAVDKAILLVAVSELVYARRPPPPAVVINEALELAKVYGTADSSRFIHGVLGALAQKL